MMTSLSQTQRVMNAYADALLRHGDFAQYFSDDVVATLEGTDQQNFEGRDAVRTWITSAHARGTITMRKLIAGEGHAAFEGDFVRKDGVAVPYSVIYDLADGKITKLNLYFTGPIQA